MVAIAAGGYHSLALAGDQAPFLIAPLVDRTEFLGTTVRFITAASGTRPLHYQWKLNGTNLPGATNAFLTFTNLQSSQAGSYSVVVSNAFGDVTSSSARLTLAPLIITALPQSQYTFKGATVSFSVDVQGASRLSYRWHFEDADLPGATNSALVLNNVQVTQSGAYSVDVSNTYGAFTSPEANLSVTTVPAWGGNFFGQTNVLKDLTNIVAIAAGIGHSLALRSDGRVVVWGDNTYGQTNMPAGLTNVIAIAAGDLHNLALKSDGTVAAWGADTTNSGEWPNFGQSVVPSGLTNVVAISGGGLHSLALTSGGAVVAWGDNRLGQTDVPAGVTDVVAVAAGGFHSLRCSVTERWPPGETIPTARRMHPRV